MGAVKKSKAYFSAACVSRNLSLDTGRANRPAQRRLPEKHRENRPPRF
jgi:hypothetical protein